MAASRTSQNNWQTSAGEDFLQLFEIGVPNPILWIDGNGVLQNFFSAVPTKTAQNTWQTNPGEDFLQLSVSGAVSPEAWISSDGTFGGTLVGDLPGFSNFVQVNLQNSLDSATSSSIALLNSVTAGNLIFLLAANNFPIVVSDSQGNAYTQLGSVAGSYTILYYAVAKSSGPLTATISYGSPQTFSGSIIAEYTNPFPTSPLDVIIADEVISPSLNVSESFTTRYTNERVLMFQVQYGASSNYVASNSVQYRADVVQNGSTFVLIDHAVSSAGSVVESGVVQDNPFGVAVLIVSIKSRG